MLVKIREVFEVLDYLQEVALEKQPFRVPKDACPKTHSRCCIPQRKAGKILSQFIRRTRRPLPWSQIESKLYAHSSRFRSFAD